MKDKTEMKSITHETTEETFEFQEQPTIDTFLIKLAQFETWIIR